MERRDYWIMYLADEDWSGVQFHGAWTCLVGEEDELVKGLNLPSNTLRVWLVPARSGAEYTRGEFTKVKGFETTLEETQRQKGE